MSSPGIRFQAPPLRQPEEPPALLPPKKRWAWLSRNPTTEATDPAPTSPLAVEPQIPTTPAPKAASAAAAGHKRCFSSLQPLAGDHKPNAGAPAAADGKPFIKKPKVVRKVRRFAVRSKVFGRKEITDAPEAAPAAIAAEPFPLQAVAVVKAESEEEQEPGEFIPDKPIADGSNAVAPSQPLLDEDMAAAAVAGEEEEEAAGAGEPPVAEMKLVMSGEKGEECGDEPGIFGLEEMKMREVFVGALHRDAKEEDVRAALAAEAGEITCVRVIMHLKMKKKNRGYCFVRFRQPTAVTRAVAAAVQGNVKICGKPCRIEVLDSSKLRIAQGDPFEDYTRIPYTEKRPFRNPRARNGSNAYATETSSLVLADQGSHMEADINLKLQKYTIMLDDLQIGWLSSRCQ
ncbi:unnamed protein product [Urochloa decumbens]|uniref:RRM domain-containing protein n=1 Tax=Urochloa decumbens TaxID=240449 RepID=A0ABC9F119_9POAL